MTDFIRDELNQNDKVTDLFIDVEFRMAFDFADHKLSYC